MGQQEILDILEQRKGEKLTSTDLEKLLPTMYASVSTSLKKLRQYKFIKHDKMKIKTAHGERRLYRYWV